MRIHDDFVGWRWISWPTAALALLLLAGCLPLIPPQQTQAAESLRAVMQDFPKVEGFDLLGSYEESFSDSTCHYARVYLFYGSNLPVPELLDRYTRAMETQGWILLTDELHSEYMAAARSFTRSDQEFMYLGTFEPTTFLQGFFDYQSASKTYKHISHIRIDYILPKRDGC